MDRVGSGLFWAYVLTNLPRLMAMLARGLTNFTVWFIIAAFVGMFINGFSGYDDPLRGPVTHDQVEVYAVGTLDNLDVTVRNLNPDHKIKRLDMDCGNTNVLIKNIEPGETKNYSSYTPNIMRGQIQCVFLRLHSYK